MQILVDRRFAEKVPGSDLDRSDGKTWYLPHHGVYHMPKKKIKVVFDCSSCYQGISHLISPHLLFRSICGEMQSVEAQLSTLESPLHVPHRELLTWK